MKLQELQFYYHTTHSVIVSRAVMYFFHVGVLKSLHSGNLSSRTPTFEKNVMTASINCCVSEVEEETCSSRQPRRMSRATRAIAVSQKDKNSCIHLNVTQVS